MGEKEYIEGTKALLRRYNELRVLLANREAAIKVKEYELAHGIAAPVSKYGDEPKGGAPELNTVEQAAARRMKLAESLDHLRAEVKKLQGALSTIDRAFEGLTYCKQLIVQGHYIEGRGWIELGEELHFSERWTRHLGQEAIEQMAGMMLGFQAQPLKLDFLF